MSFSIALRLLKILSRYIFKAYTTMEIVGMCKTLQIKYYILLTFWQVETYSSRFSQ